MLNNMKISTRLMFLLSSLLVLAMVVGGMGLYASSQVNTAMESVYADRLVPMGQLSVINERTVLIRLLPFFDGTARMSPFTGIKFGVSGGGGVTRNTQQRAESVERIEAAIEAKRKFIEIGL